MVSEQGILCLANKGVFSGVKLFPAKVLWVAILPLCAVEGVAWFVSGKYMEGHKKEAEQTATSPAA